MSYSPFKPRAKILLEERENMGSSNTGSGDKKANEETAGATSPPESPASADFSEGEKVLAYHGPRLYQAKVQKVEHMDDEWRYHVHYLGWNKNWDEWVATERLLKFTDDNVRKQKTIDKKQVAIEKKQTADKTPKSGSGRSTQNKLKNSSDVKTEKEDKSDVARGKKRKGQSTVEEKETKSMERQVLGQFPLTLKKQLVDDWEYVTQLGKLVKLPRSPTVDDILKRYLEYRTKKDGMVTESVGEILKGLRCYFDKALLAMLLYKKERQQYHDVISGNVSPSTIYGAEHLLRLFVKLPELLAYVNMEEEASVKLQQKLLDFLKFLQKNQSSFFLSTYDGPKKMEESD